MDVDDHGIPGVVFAHPFASDGLINAFAFSDASLACGPLSNIFSDAVNLGYQPLVVTGDLRDLAGTWRDELLAGSLRINSSTYFAEVKQDKMFCPEEICFRLGTDIKSAIRSRPDASSPALIWVFVDLDQYVHYFGYDNEVRNFLVAFDNLCAGLASSHVVLAHSDHGLTETHNHPDVAALLQDLPQTGGAGRVRWIYTSDQDESRRVESFLRRHLPASISICRSCDVFRPGSPSQLRAGNVVLIARGRHFITPISYRYEHGSMSAEEVFVPFARWANATSS